jgi:hypothetical protein
VAYRKGMTPFDASGNHIPRNAEHSEITVQVHVTNTPRRPTPDRRSPLSKRPAASQLRDRLEPRGPGLPLPLHRSPNQAPRFASTAVPGPPRVSGSDAAGAAKTNLTLASSGPLPSCPWLTGVRDKQDNAVCWELNTYRCLLRAASC